MATSTENQAEPKQAEDVPPYRLAEEPRKSDSDTSTYRGLELRNGLKVLLISDPDTDKAAAALTVQVIHRCIILLLMLW